MPTCSPWSWPCPGCVSTVAPGWLNTLFPSVAWKVKGSWRLRAMDITLSSPVTRGRPLLSSLPLSLSSGLHQPTNQRWNKMLHYCNNTALWHFLLRLHINSYLGIFELTAQFCTFSVTMAGRQGGKRNERPVSFLSKLRLSYSEKEKHARARANSAKLKV